MKKLLTALICFVVLLGAACQRAPQKPEAKKAEPARTEPVVTKRSKIVIFDLGVDVKGAAFDGAVAADSIIAKARKLKCPKPDWDSLYQKAQPTTAKPSENPEAAELSAAAACQDLISFEGLRQFLRNAGYAVEQIPVEKEGKLKTAMKDHPSEVRITMVQRLSESPKYFWGDSLNMRLTYPYEISIPALAKKQKFVVQVEHTEPSLLGNPGGMWTGGPEGREKRQKTAEALVKQEREVFAKMSQWLNENAE